MSRVLSLNARTALDDANSDEIEIALIRISHPDLAEPVRLSSDPTERLSVEPLSYGTRSTWRTEDGSPFLFILMSTLLPGDQEDAPQSATLVLDAVDADMARVLRMTTTRATVDMAVVLASSPNLVEAEWLGLKLMGAEGDASQIMLEISREPIDGEPWPAARMTRQRFPGLHR